MKLLEYIFGKTDCSFGDKMDLPIRMWIFYNLNNRHSIRFKVDEFGDTLSPFLKKLFAWSKCKYLLYNKHKPTFILP